MKALLRDLILKWRNMARSERKGAGGLRAKPDRGEDASRMDGYADGLDRAASDLEKFAGKSEGE